MRITVVPNRNAIMLTIAFGLATAKRAQTVAAAMHGGDHFIYPDCRPPFVEAFAAMQQRALDGLWANCIGDPIPALEQGRHCARGWAAWRTL
jgi:7-cyano-7-deazaguanine synthase